MSCDYCYMVLAGRYHVTICYIPFVGMCHMISCNIMLRDMGNVSRFKLVWQAVSGCDVLLLSLITTMSFLLILTSFSKPLVIPYYTRLCCALLCPLLTLTSLSQTFTILYHTMLCCEMHPRLRSSELRTWVERQSAHTNAMPFIRVEAQIFHDDGQFCLNRTDYARHKELCSEQLLLKA